MVFGRELLLPCDLFGPSPSKEQSTTDCVADLVDRLHDVHHAFQHLKVVIYRMKASSTGFEKGVQVCLCHPTRTKEKSAELQSSAEGPYKVHPDQQRGRQDPATDEDDGTIPRGYSGRGSIVARARCRGPVSCVITSASSSQFK